MDPDATLAEIRALVARLVGEVDEVATDEVLRLADLVEALDKWLAGGGFLPAAWRRDVEHPPCLACGAYEPEHADGCALAPGFQVGGQSVTVGCFTTTHDGHRYGAGVCYVTVGGSRPMRSVACLADETRRITTPIDAPEWLADKGLPIELARRLVWRALEKEEQGR